MRFFFLRRGQFHLFLFSPVVGSQRRGHGFVDRGAHVDRPVCCVGGREQGVYRRGGCCRGGEGAEER